MDDDLCGCANWILIRIMTSKQKVRYVMFTAEQVVHICIAKYPNDDWPQRSIQAAKDYLDGKIDRDVANTIVHAINTSPDLSDNDNATHAKNAIYHACKIALCYTTSSVELTIFAAFLAANNEARELIIRHGLEILKEE